MLNYSPEKKKEFLDAAVKILSGDSANSADRALICHGLAAMSAESQGLDFQEIGDHLYDGVYIADGSGMTLYVNKSYERITGLKAEEVVGRYVQDLLDEPVRDSGHQRATFLMYSFRASMCSSSVSEK